MFFAVSPQRSALSDLNEELIDTFRWVRDEPDRLVAMIKRYPVDRATYNSIRAQHTLTGIERAARFLYLNRTCYGGLYRTNRKGEFNVPFGGGSRNPECLWKRRLLKRAATLLAKSAKLTCCDFEETIRGARCGDVIYCDPTYSNVERNQFDRYGSTVFSWSDQERLAAASKVAASRGVTVLLSNGHFPNIQNLYDRALRVELEKKKTIGNAARSDSVHDELLFVLEPDEDRKRNVWIVAGLVDRSNRGRRAGQKLRWLGRRPALERSLLRAR